MQLSMWREALKLAKEKAEFSASQAEIALHSEKMELVRVCAFNAAQEALAAARAALDAYQATDFTGKPLSGQKS